MFKLAKIIKKLKTNNKGFTITELMVSVSLISSVAALGATQLNDILPTARDAQRMGNIKQMQTALNLYYDDHLQYPISTTNTPSSNDYLMLQNHLNQNGNEYISDFPIDPLNSDGYQFKYWSDGQKFKITYETEDELDESPRFALGI